MLATLISLCSPALAVDGKATKKPAAAENSCGGSDLLAELATTDPAAYARVTREAETTVNGNALLWKIERDGTPASYIFATLHLTDERITNLPDKVRDALGASTQVLLEAADVSPGASASALADASKAALFSDGQTLEKLLTPEEYAKAKAALDLAGLPGAVVHLYRPWIVSLFIAATACEREKLKRGIPILDMKIAAEAKSRGTPVAGLETIDQQLTALASLPEDQQLGMLRANLAMHERTKDLMETLVRLYLDRRTGAAWPLQLALAEKAGIGASAFQGFQDKIVNERNIKMRDAAMPYLDKGGAFIAVGALHLIGKAGLVELIREKGYTVTRLE